MAATPGAGRLRCSDAITTVVCDDGTDYTRHHHRRLPRAGRFAREHPEPDPLAETPERTGGDDGLSDPGRGDDGQSDPGRGDDEDGGLLSGIARASRPGAEPGPATVTRPALHPATTAVALLVLAGLGAWLLAPLLLASVAGAGAGYANSGST